MGKYLLFSFARGLSHKAGTDEGIDFCNFCDCRGNYIFFICTGFAAIAYVDGIDTRENRSQGGVKNKNLVPDKESAVNDADVTVNEAIFDVLSRRGDAVSDDSDENFFSASENGVSAGL